jgi:anti-anti-sigma factor
MSSERFPVQWHEKLAVVTLPDEADLSNAVAIQDGLMSALSQRPAALVVDMSPTTFCDSAGVRAVMLAYKQALATGCELRLVIGTPGVLRVFSLLGADQLVAIYPRLDSALDAAANGAAAAGAGPRHEGATPGHDAGPDPASASRDHDGTAPSAGGAQPSAVAAVMTRESLRMPRICWPYFASLLSPTPFTEASPARVAGASDAICRKVASWKIT